MQVSLIKTKGFHDKYMPLPLQVGQFSFGYGESLWGPRQAILNKSYFKTYPHGSFKRACQDVINWKLRVIAPDLSRDKKSKSNEILLFLYPNYPNSVSTIEKYLHFLHINQI